MLPLPTVHMPSIAIAGTDARFPVRRIFCVGRNYADHAREMGGDPTREAPFFFTKPGDAVIDSGSVLPLPNRTAELHHEVELVLALGAGGSAIAIEDAASKIFGYGVGIDLTRRDLQAEAKKAGRPWDMAKGFDRSAPVGPLVTTRPDAAAEIALSVDGAVRQRGSLSDMIWTIEEIIASLSTYVTLAGGDLIFTGTPAGVGPVARGEGMRGTIAGLPPIEIRVAD
ncbi:fumarylacetoacetate hydrolase family protein [Sphingomonas echinoides]|uniref:fumarylacetoacetate hydrolase family protein n=1 Tax=Sphingomonas echinoides TaxID=59803 RepID=UPI002413B87B|nr:fumarylacetoacetate hydrolase family protein [Sphingomonas echinoides]